MLKPIKTRKQYEIALERVYNLMQKEIIPNSKETYELERLSSLVEMYGDKYFKLT
jgi:HTH-type transcriptional regulator/antitoxin HigA